MAQAYHPPDNWQYESPPPSTAPTPPMRVDEFPWWCVWKLESRKGKPTKVPYTPRSGQRAETDNPNTFGTRAEAEQALTSGQYAGLGVLIHESLDVTAGDLDHVVPEDHAFDELAIPPDIRAIIDLADTVTMWSPSGTGIRFFFAGTAPHYKNKNSADALCDAEAYWRVRFMTVTEKPISGTPDTFNDNMMDLSAWYEALTFEKRQRKQANERIATNWHPDDQQLLESALRARNGERLRRLLDGNISGYKESQGDKGFSSEADAALIGILGFWTQDRAQLARIWRGSKLGKRAKLDRDDYVTRTIDSVLELGGETYDPDYRSTPTTEGKITANSVPLGTENADADAETPTDRAALDAEIRRLTAELDTARETITTREKVIARERAIRKDAEAQLERLRVEKSRAVWVLRNPDLSAGQRLTGFALALNLSARASNGEMPSDHGYNVPSIALAEMTGQTEQACARHLREFDQLGIIHKRVVRESVTSADRETGEIEIGARDRNYINLEGGTVIDLAERLATFQRPEDAPKHGGKRTPRCELHPNAGTIKTWHIACAECRRVLDRGETYQAPDDLDTDADTSDINLIPDPRVIDTSLSDINLIPEPTPIWPEADTDPPQVRRCMDCSAPLAPGEKTLCPACFERFQERDRRHERRHRKRMRAGRICVECDEPTGLPTGTKPAEQWRIAPTPGSYNSDFSDYSASGAESPNSTNCKNGQEAGGPVSRDSVLVDMWPNNRKGPA